MKKLGLPELTEEQIEELCKTAEESARQHVYREIRKKQVETLNIFAEVEGSFPVSLTIEVDLLLVESAKNKDPKKLANDAVAEAFCQAEKYLKVALCHSPK